MALSPFSLGCSHLLAPIGKIDSPTPTSKLLFTRPHYFYYFISYLRALRKSLNITLF